MRGRACYSEPRRTLIFDRKVGKDMRSTDTDDEGKRLMGSSTENSVFGRLAGKMMRSTGTTDRQQFVEDLELDKQFCRGQ